MQQNFPKWKYSKHGSRIVDDVDQEEALGDEWVDSPALLANPEPGDAPVEDPDDENEPEEKKPPRGGGKRK